MTDALIAANKNNYTIKLNSAKGAIGSTTQVSDWGGFNNIQYNQKASDGKYYGSFVDWTIAQWGSGTDPLGLNGCFKNANSPQNITYVYIQSIADPTAPTTTTQHTNAAPPAGTPNIGSGSTAAIINSSQCYPTPVYGRNPDGTMYVDHYIPCK